MSRGNAPWVSGGVFLLLWGMSGVCRRLVTPPAVAPAQAGAAKFCGYRYPSGGPGLRRGDGYWVFTTFNGYSAFTTFASSAST